MSKRPLSLKQLVLRLGLAWLCIAVIAFCAGNVGPDIFVWIASLM